MRQLREGTKPFLSRATNRPPRAPAALADFPAAKQRADHQGIPRPGGELSASGLLCFYDLIDGAQLEGIMWIVRLIARRSCPLAGRRRLLERAPALRLVEVGDLGGHRQQDCYGDRAQRTRKRTSASPSPLRHHVNAPKGRMMRIGELAQCVRQGILAARRVTAATTQPASHNVFAKIAASTRKAMSPVSFTPAGSL